MEELTVYIEVTAVAQADNFANADVRAVVSTFCFVAVTAVNITHGVVEFVFKHTCAERTFCINAVFIFVPCRNAAAVVNHAAVTTEELVIKAVVSTVIATAVFVEYAPAELTAVIELIGITDTDNRTPAINFNIVRNIILAAVTMYSGKGFNAVTTVAAKRIQAVAD